MKYAHLAIIGAFAGLMTMGCRGQVSEDPPIILIRNMHKQAKLLPQEEDDFFADHRSMRTPVAGTVARNRFEDNEEVATGRLVDGSGYVLTVPDDVVGRFGGMDAMLLRGQERFGIYCSPCHDKSGYGNGTVVQRGFQKPTSLHDARIRQMPDGQVFATISNGVRNMPSYGPQVPVADRWAVVAYVRALELSQVAQMEPRK